MCVCAQRLFCSFFCRNLFLSTCPRSKRPFFVTQSLTSDGCMCACVFIYPLLLFYISLSPPLVSEHPPPLLLCLRARRQALLQLPLALVHLETRGGRTGKHSLCIPVTPSAPRTPPTPTPSRLDSIGEADGHITVRIWAKFRLFIVCLWLCRTSAAGVHQVINAHPVEHLRGMWGIFSS